MLQSSNDKYCLGRRLYFCCPNARNKNARGIKGGCVIARQNPKLSATQIKNTISIFQPRVATPFPPRREQCDHLHFAAELEMKESHGRIFCATLGPPLWPFPILSPSLSLPFAIPRTKGSRPETNCENYGNFYQSSPAHFVPLTLARDYLRLIHTNK